jgi:hypothetical protein
LKSVPTDVKVAAGRSADVKVPITSLPSALNGTYTLLAVVTDSTGKSAVTDGQSPFAYGINGASFTVSAPFIGFAEYFQQITLPGNVTSGVKTRAIVQVNVANTGNIISRGKSIVSLYLSPDGMVDDGALIRTVHMPIVLKPGANRVITVPLLFIPAVSAGNYDLVVQVTDPENHVNQIADGASPFGPAYESLGPFGTYSTAAAGGAWNVNFTVGDSGNFNFPAKRTTFNLYASTDGTLASGTLVYTHSQQLAWKPNQSRNFKFRLTAAQWQTVVSQGMLIVQVIDFTGASMTWTSSV